MALAEPATEEDPTPLGSNSKLGFQLRNRFQHTTQQQIWVPVEKPISGCAQGWKGVVYCMLLCDTCFWLRSPRSPPRCIIA